VSGSAPHGAPGQDPGSRPGVDGTADRHAGSPVLVGPYCGRCGEPTASGDHAGCSASLVLEPPRFCATCRRRMVVQVLPRGWTARCSRHRETSSYS